MCKYYLSNFPNVKSTVCTYIHIKLLLICLLAPSYYYHKIYTYYCSDEHHKYSTIFTQYAQILLLSYTMLKYYYYYTICSNTTIFMHRATNPLRSTWARAAAHVVSNYMSGYGTLGSGILHSTCANHEI